MQSPIHRRNISRRLGWVLHVRRRVGEPRCSLLAFVPTSVANAATPASSPVETLPCGCPVRHGAQQRLPNRVARVGGRDFVLTATVGYVISTPVFPALLNRCPLHCRCDSGRQWHQLADARHPCAAVRQNRIMSEASAFPCRPLPTSVNPPPNLTVNRTRRFIPSCWRTSARRAGYLQR